MEKNQKQRKLISIENLPKDILKLVEIKYPDGFDEHIVRVSKSNSEYMSVLNFETEDTIYLIKVKPKPSKPIDDDDDDDSADDNDTPNYDSASYYDNDDSSDSDD